MILRVPWLSEPEHAFTSLVILAASSAMILRTYNQLLATNFFRAKWTETRRFLTAAYVQLYCTIQGEVPLQDFHATSTIVTKLLVHSRLWHPAVTPVMQTWQTLVELIRKSTVLHFQDHVVTDHAVPQQSKNSNSYRSPEKAPFDYTLPLVERQADDKNGPGLAFDYD
jgi:hypothetical protein